MFQVNQTSDIYQTGDDSANKTYFFALMPEIHKKYLEWG
jgi:hypothetical protein